MIFDHPHRTTALAGALLGILLALARPARAEEVIGFYRATWAGLPAAEMRLAFGGSGTRYRDEIDIETKGLARLFTKFRGGAVAEGRLGDDGLAAPSRYDALYDLRKRRDSRISMRFISHHGAVVAERTPADTSHKPPIDETYRRDVTDPLSALASIRHVLKVKPPKPGGQFRIPVYDGSRRFDIAVRVVAVGGEHNLVQLKLTLVPIAGFKGGSSEDGDPDDAPRPVDLAFTNDAALVPVSIRVSVAYLPLVIRFQHRCETFAGCVP
ncbi:MAG TPA: DUF3108 domain-containing protein [Stellaceae bacterium]|nr:DUF3108 domain-containing protein [Stellaceae bacterium]